MDATEALEKVDNALDEPLSVGLPKQEQTDGEEGANSSRKESLIDPETGIVLEDHYEDDDTLWKSPSEATLEEMKERLLSVEAVFLDPLEVAEKEESEKESEGEGETAETKDETEAAPDENKSDGDPLQVFLKDFDVGSKTEEISELLKTNVALQTTFSMLSDSVSYADFWTRYFYRLDDEERLVNTYNIYYQKHLEELERAEEEAKKSSTMGRMTNFLGGVVSKLTVEDPATDDDGVGIDQSMESSDTLDSTNDDTPGISAMGSALGGFLSTVAGNAGRPPFVMNTAVSDDDDIGAAEDDDDEDSEVELGWDDDDEDDYDDLDDDDNAVAFQEGDDRSETVDFKDAEKEGLLEELEQARAERDALQKTVEMQAAELKKAAATTPSSSPPAASTSEDSSNTASACEETLKLQLFEKDAELAALRSKLADQSNDDDNDDTKAVAAKQQEQRIESLEHQLIEKEQNFQMLKKATQAQTKTLEEKLQEQANAQQKLIELEKRLAEKDSQLQEQAQTNQAAADGDSQQKDQEIANLQQSLSEKVDEQKALQTELDSVKEVLASRDEELSVLRTNSEDTAKLSELTQKLQEADSAKQEFEAKLASVTEEVEGLMAQLAAVTKDLEDSQQVTMSAKKDLEAQLASMTKELEASQQETIITKKDLETQLASLAKELENAKQQDTAGANAGAEQLALVTQELESCQQETAQATAQNQKLAMELDSVKGDFETYKKEILKAMTEKGSELETSKQEITQARAEAETCRTELHTTIQTSELYKKEMTKVMAEKAEQFQIDLEASQEETLRAQEEIESLKAEVTQLKEAALSRPTSPGSNDSGVKIESDHVPAIPATPNAAQALGVEISENNDDDEDDGWGDDW